MAGSAPADNAPAYPVSLLAPETRPLLAWPKVDHRMLGFSAGRHATEPETPPLCESCLFSWHRGSSQRLGSRNPQGARRVLPAPRPAGYGPGEMFGGPGAGSSSRPDTNVHSSPPRHRAPPYD